jgi:tetratricopeptide (TPR) repeat protein
MKIHKQIFFISLIALAITLSLGSCKTTLSIADMQKSAEQAFNEGNYNAALQHYESLIAKWNEDQPFEENPYYDPAGHTAFALRDYDKAIEYFNHSTHYGFAGANTYLALISHYREMENFSREMTAINALIEKYPDSAAEAGLHGRLFEMYVETSRWEEAEAQIPKINREPDVNLLEQMLLVHKNLGNEGKEVVIVDQLLKFDTNNKTALEWKAINYFEAGEARYNAESEAYERNKSRSQYARLLKGYEVAGEDYRKARDIFERLYKQNPDKKYAMYLYNIYARFQDEEKAAYYRQRF